MQTITFTCQTITPMFLAGVDQSKAELRPPSIKGALRFWWRAMQGDLVKNDHLELKQKELLLFGGTGGFKIKDRKQEAFKSQFNLRIGNVNERTISNAKSLIDGKGGLKYLFYLLANDMTDRTSAFNVNTTFNVVLTAEKEEPLLQAAACFWLMTYFGGIGTRARRGGGSIAITEVHDPLGILNGKLAMIPESGKSIKGYLADQLQKIKGILNGSFSSGKKFSTLSENSFFLSSRYFNSWEEALNDIGAKMKNIRTSNQERKFTQQTLDQKAAFGLPISVRNETNNVEFADKETHNHRSSPVVLSVAKDSKDKFYWTVTRLYGDFMPENEKIVFGSTSWSNEDNSLLNEFMDDIVAEKAYKILD